MNFRKIIVNIVSAALALLAWFSCSTGCMEFFEAKNYFEMGEELCFVFALFFSLMVAAFAFQGFKDFIYSVTNKDKKE